MTMLTIASPVPTREFVLATLDLWMTTGGMTAQPTAPTPRRRRSTFDESDVLWSIELRPGFSEIDDPAAHRHIPQHAYLVGCDSVAICGHRASARQTLGGRPRLGMPSPSHDIQCRDCRELVRRPDVTPATATIAEPTPRLDEAFGAAEDDARRNAMIDTQLARPPVGIAAWRRSVAARPSQVRIREDILLAPDYRGRRAGEMPPKLGVCEFTTADHRCSKPGRWHRHGTLSCLVHAAARSPRPWGVSAAA